MDTVTRRDIRKYLAGNADPELRSRMVDELADPKSEASRLLAFLQSAGPAPYPKGLYPPIESYDCLSGDTFLAPRSDAKQRLNRTALWKATAIAAVISTVVACYFALDRRGLGNNDIEAEIKVASVDLLAEIQGTFGPDTTDMTLELAITVDASKRSQRYIYILVKAGNELRQKGVLDLQDSEAVLFPTLKANGDGKPLWAIESDIQIAGRIIQDQINREGVTRTSRQEEIEAAIGAVLADAKVRATKLILTTEPE